MFLSTVDGVIIRNAKQLYLKVIGFCRDVVFVHGTHISKPVTCFLWNVYQVRKVSGVRSNCAFRNDETCSLIIYRLLDIEIIYKCEFAIFA